MPFSPSFEMIVPYFLYLTNTYRVDMMKPL